MNYLTYVLCVCVCVQVNCVRSCMNVMLSTDPAERGVVAWGSNAIRRIQKKARANLLM